MDLLLLTSQEELEAYKIHVFEDSELPYKKLEKQAEETTQWRNSLYIAAAVTNLTRKKLQKKKAPNKRQDNKQH